MFSMKHHQPMNAGHNEMYCKNCLMVIIKYFNRYFLAMQSLQQITSKLPISKKLGFYYSVHFNRIDKKDLNQKVQGKAMTSTTLRLKAEVPSPLE